MLEDEPNRFIQVDVPLMHQTGLELRVVTLDPAKTWLRSITGLCPYFKMLHTAPLTTEPAMHQQQHQTHHQHDGKQDAQRRGAGNGAQPGFGGIKGDNPQL